LFIFIRANLPRFRFDQLMFIGWKIFLPLALSFLIFFSSFLLSFNSVEISQLPRLSYKYNYIQVFSTRF
jgi:NADH-quinone oxidoreductase subunit H